MKMAVMTDSTTEEQLQGEAPAPTHNGEGNVAPDVAEAPVLEFAEQETEFGGETVGNVRCENPFMVAENVNVYYGDNHAIRDVTLEIGKKERTA